MALAINFLYNQIKNVQNGKKRTLGTIPKSQFKTHRNRLTPLNTHIHDRPFSWLGTGASIKSCGYNIVVPDTSLPF